MLLGYDCGRFEELLRIEGLNHGTLTVSGNALVQRKAFYVPGAPNCSPAGFKTVEWFWNGEDFVVRPKAWERNFVYKSFNTGGAMPAEIDELITRKALEMDVPPVLVKAIAMVETGGRHYNDDGTVKTGPCGEIGLMQVLPDPNIFTPEEIERLKDPEFNMEYGIKTLVAKKMYGGYVTPVFIEPGDEDVINMDDNILETWYFAIWAYNGRVQANNPGYAGEGNTYQDRVIRYVRNLGADIEAVSAGSFTGYMPRAGECFPLPGRHCGGLLPLIPGTKATVCNASRLNVREKPAVVYGIAGEEVTVTGSMPEGEDVEVLEGPYTGTRCRWYRIRRSNGGEGWAAGAYRYDPGKLAFRYYLNPGIPLRGGAGGEAPRIWEFKTTTGVNRAWTVKFNMPVDPGTINDDNIKVMAADGSSVAVRVTAGAGGGTALVAPLTPYDKGREYYLYIGTGVKSLNGKMLKKPVVMRFGTAGTSPG